MRRPKRPTVDLLLIFVGVFVVQQVAGLLGFGTAWFALAAPFERPWTLVTTVYAHAGLGHLLANALGVVVVGLALERSTSRVRFHVFVLVTGMLAAVAEILVGAALGTPVSVLGASGAILAAVGYVIAGSRLTSGVLSRVDLSRRASVGLLLGAAVAVTIATAGPGVALVAHFTGFVLGLIAGRLRLLRRERKSRYRCV